MIFDTHAHYDDEAFDTDRDELLSRLKEMGVTRIIDPGCDLPSTEKARSIAHRYPGVYFAAGIHPENLDDLPENWIDRLRTFASDERCAAIGEIGLDYYWDKSRIELQKEVFRAQMKLAEELNLPVIIHDREAHEDSMKIVLEFPNVRGVFHCYSGSAEMAKELLKRGWYLGFDGPVTYKNARKALEVLEICPKDRMLIETDSPYLSPVPMRGKRNDSGNLIYVAEKIAEVLGMEREEVLQLTDENGKRLFTRISD